MIDGTTSQSTDWAAMRHVPPIVLRPDFIGGKPRLATPVDLRMDIGPHRAVALDMRRTPATARPVGRLETMALAEQAMSPPRSRLLGTLLQAANPESCGGHPILRPLWSNETMHRAYQMVRLTRVLDGEIPCHDRDRADTDLEGRIARGLANTLLSLRIEHDKTMQSCSEVLRDLVRDLVELFGGAVGVGGICTHIERLELAAFKRRALVLMACHLVIEVLSDAFREGRGGQVLVTLERPSDGLARLAVGYDEPGVPFGPLDGSGVIDDFASLLESDVSYRAERGRIVAGVEFTVD